MELKDLVPPLELCKLIPEGEFADSAFAWALRKAEPPYIGRAIGVNMGSVIDGDYCLCTREYAGKVRWVHGKDNIPCPTVPAPTLEEILQELVNLSAYRLNVCKSWGEWHIDCYDNERLIEKDSVKNIATAALKLWLKLKGIDHE
jgi:hypothetical protein